MRKIAFLTLSHTISRDLRRSGRRTTRNWYYETRSMPTPPNWHADATQCVRSSTIHWTGGSAGGIVRARHPVVALRCAGFNRVGSGERRTVKE